MMCFCRSAIRFCARAARYQLEHSRYFLAENSFPTWLVQEDGWRQFVSHSSVKSVVFDQCRTNLRMEGVLMKKPTILIANATELLEPFQNLRCTGRHEHWKSWGKGGALGKAEVWTWQFAERIVDGILRLKSRLRRDHRHTYPTVGTDASPPAAAASSAGPDPQSWRKCPGCRGCLSMHRREHTRIPG